MNYGFILLANGKSERMKLSTPKPFLTMGDGRMVIEHALDAPVKLQIETVVVTNPEYFYLLKSLPCKVVEGGKTRLDSIKIGLEVFKNRDYVIIHDAARPGLTAKFLLNSIKVWEESKKLFGIHIFPCYDSVISSKGVSMPREELFRTQTPTFVQVSLLEKLLEKESNRSLLDLYSESMGLQAVANLCQIQGSHSLEKLTTQEDYYFYKDIL